MVLKIDILDVAMMLRHTVQNISDAETSATVAEMIVRDLARLNETSFDELFALLQEITDAD